MRLLLLGPPGSGKGTQAKLLSKKHNIPHISTGDMLREAITNATSIGCKARQYVESGGLVPDNIIVGIIEERLLMSDANNGFVLDGFPRTENQAKELISLLDRLNKPLQAIIRLDCSDSVIVDRICGRRVCPKCGVSYHVEYKKPKIDGICDVDGTALIQRSDDHQDKISHRLNKYYGELRSIQAFYVNICTINANQSEMQTELDIDNYLNANVS